MKKRFLALILIFAMLVSFGIYLTVNAGVIATPARSALITYIDTLNDYKSTDYTTASWAIFIAEKNKAIAVYLDANATDDQLTSALLTLQSAVGNLVKITAPTTPSQSPPPVYPVGANPALTEPTTESPPPATTPAKVYSLGTNPTETPTTVGETTEEITSSEMPLANIYVSPFTDFKETDWFASAIRIMDQRGLMGNYGNDYTFSPNKFADRYTLAQILYRLSDKPELTADAKLKFKDVDDKSYSDAVIWASSNDLMKGFEDGSFRGNDPLTVEQIAVVLYRYANMLALDVSAKADLSKYEYADKISDWAVDAMQWAIAVGLTNVNGDTELAPDKEATRSETAAIVAKFLSEIIDVKN